MSTSSKSTDLTVLVIDDNPLELGLIRLVLQKNFPDVKCIALTRVPDWQSFLQSQKVDVIIIDYRLPEKNGIEHIKDLRKVDKDVYTFLITALERDEIDQDITSSGATDFIVKDRSYSNLISKLNNVILNESVKQIEDDLKSYKLILNELTDFVILKINFRDELVDVSGNIEKFKLVTGINNIISEWKKYFEETYVSLKSEIEENQRSFVFREVEIKANDKKIRFGIYLLKSHHNFYLILKPF
jgi:response regulator RpfG family c-di-GMP phosphodiesterase